MFRNYLKLACAPSGKTKAIRHQYFWSAVGIATCLLNLIFVIDELSYDRFNKKADRIYRVDADIMFGGNHMIMAVVSDPMGPTLKARLSGSGAVYAFSQLWRCAGTKGAENVKEDK
jgi:putative ABC transport system permease protein